MGSLVFNFQEFVVKFAVLLCAVLFPSISFAQHFENMFAKPAVVNDVRPIRPIQPPLPNPQPTTIQRIGNFDYINSGGTTVVCQQIGTMTYCN